MSKASRVVVCLIVAVLLFGIALFIAASWITSSHHDAFVDGGLVAVAAALVFEQLP